MPVQRFIKLFEESDPGLRSWMAPSGKIYSLTPSDIHELWARRKLDITVAPEDEGAWGALAEVGAEALFKKGWLRIVPYGSNILAQTTLRRKPNPSQTRQLGELLWMYEKDLVMLLSGPTEEKPPFQQILSRKELDESHYLERYWASPDGKLIPCGGDHQSVADRMFPETWGDAAFEKMFEAGYVRVCVEDGVIYVNTSLSGKERPIRRKAKEAIEDLSFRKRRQVFDLNRRSMDWGWQPTTGRTSDTSWDDLLKQVQDL